MTRKDVVNVSKIKISKAIHNSCSKILYELLDVVNVSKIKISKAIHNYSCFHDFSAWDVVNVSKIKISKAIHNGRHGHRCICGMLSMCQR